MSMYLVKIRPLDLFSFSTDQKNEYPDDTFSTGKETYFLRSRQLPPQTTILGMIRYILLDSEKLLKSDFNYNAQDRVKMSELIGKESFSFAVKTEVQSFGIIHSISPVFLINEKGEYLVSNPLNNKAKSQGYDPIIMSENKTVTSSGELSLPSHGEYDAKEGFASGYYNLTTGEIEHEIFKSQYRVENRKNNFEETTPKNEERDGGLFKREMLSMKEGYSFAVFLDAEFFPAESFGKMGKKKCPYYVFSEKKANDLESQVKKAFRNSSVWYYALSDLCPVQYVRPDTFFMSDTDYIRNIETDYQEKTHNKKFKKSEHRFNIYKSGSVFYSKSPDGFTNENYKKIGMNYLVKIGGENK